MVIVEAQGISFQSHSGGKVDSIDEKLSLYELIALMITYLSFGLKHFFGVWSSIFFALNTIIIFALSGVEHLSTYLKVYKVGDIIDIKVGV